MHAISIVAKRPSWSTFCSTSYNNSNNNSIYYCNYTHNVIIYSYKTHLCYNLIISPLKAIWHSRYIIQCLYSTSSNLISLLHGSLNIFYSLAQTVFSVLATRLEGIFHGTWSDKQRITNYAICATYRVKYLNRHIYMMRYGWTYATIWNTY